MLRQYLKTTEVRLLALSLVVGLISCTIIFFAAQANDTSALTLTGDARGYMLLTENLLNYHVFSMSLEQPLAPESFRSPGYPAFLALLYTLMFGNWVFVLFLQSILVSVAPVLLYILFKPYHERAAFWGALIFIFEPIRLFLSASLLTDAFFLCVLLGALLFLDTARRVGEGDYIAASGLALGVAILVRPIAMFLPIFFVLFLLCVIRPWKHALRASVTLVVVVMLCLLPWMFRNYSTFGAWGISSVGSANLMLYNAPEFLKYRPDYTGERILAAFNRQQDALPREEALSIARSPVFVWAFLKIIHGHEASYVAFHIFKTIPFFLTDGLRDTVRLFGVTVGDIPNISTALLRGNIGLVWKYVMGGGLAIALLVIGSGFWLGVCALYGFVVVRNTLLRQFGFIAVTLTLILYFALLTGPVSNARYRLPVEGFLIVGALTALLKKPDRSIHAQ